MKHDGKPMVALKRVCENLGLGWASQTQKVSAAHWACVTNIVTQLPGDTQARPTLFGDTRTVLTGSGETPLPRRSISDAPVVAGHDQPRQGTSGRSWRLRIQGLRVAVRDGEPWFVAKDATELLGYTNGPKAVRDHVLPGQTITRTIRSGNRGNPNVKVINEAGLYRLIMQSKTADAVEIQAWVTDEVLVTLRKTGGAYVDPASKADHYPVRHSWTIRDCLSSR